MKKIFCLVLAFIMILSLAGCSKGKNVSNLKSAQGALLNLLSGKITVSAQIETNGSTDTVKSEFVFLKDENGKFKFCHSQYDNQNKPIFCEFSDGDTAKQWLIGRGWSEIDAVQYSKDNPHRFIRLLSTPFDKRQVKSITSTKEDGGVSYVVTINPDRVNKTTYKEADISVLSQTVTVFVNDKNEILSYTDTSTILDKSTNTETLYMLSFVISDQNAVTKVECPELREYNR